MNFLASPNFNERPKNCSIEYVVIHYTGMKSTKDALNRLCDVNSDVSAHYLIDENGIITKMVDEKLRAWHAGKSCWKGKENINDNSIGIELSNCGHEFGYNDFSDKQLSSLKKLLKEIFEKYNLPASALLAHSDVAPNRKKDPGEKFPWKDFANSGFGIWSEKEPNIKDDNMKVLLNKIGYDCSDLDSALTAFQRRYCVEELNTENKSKTIQMLNSIANY